MNHPLPPEGLALSAQQFEAPEAEHSILGGVMSSTEELGAALEAGLRADHFADDRNAEIWASAVELHQAGRACDVVSMLEHLRSRGLDERCGGLIYLNQLAQAWIGPGRIGGHAALVMERQCRRRAVAIGRALQQAAVSGSDIDRPARIARLASEAAGLYEGAKGPSGIPFEWANEISGDLEAPQQLVEDVLTAGGMSMFYGESNSGKSYLAIHLAICVSLGVPWLGKRTQKSAVAYVAAEGAWSIKTRLVADAKHYGRPVGAFGLIPSALNLLDPSADVSELIDQVQAKSREVGQAIGLIVVDTVARVMGGGDENTAQDMGRLVGAGDRIRAETGAHVLYIHHAGKDASRGARGHSSLRAALDTEIEVTADEKSKVHTAQITKQRDLPSKGERLAAKFVPVVIGADQWGGDVTACAVEPSEVGIAPPGPKRMTSTQQAVLSYLKGRETGARRASIAQALEPQGVSRSAIYKAIGELLLASFLIDVAGVVYAPKG